MWFPDGVNINCSDAANTQCQEVLPGSNFLWKLDGCDSGPACVDIPLSSSLAQWSLLGSSAFTDPTGTPSDGLVSAASSVHPRNQGEPGTVVSPYNLDPSKYPHLTFFNDPGSSPPGGTSAYTEPWIRLLLGCPC